MKATPHFFRDIPRLFTLQISLFVFAFILCRNAVAEPVTISEIHSDAKAAAGAILSEINSAGKINDKLIAPLTDESKELKTFGPEAQKQSMTVPISAQSSGAFLIVTASASATGDIANLNLAIDSNYDGIADYTYNSPFVISGICGNGIISCNSGTWNNKRPYMWKCDSNLNVSLQLAIDQNQLLNCKCINNSCLYTPTSENKKNDLKAIGDAVLAAIQTAKPHITITHTETGINTVKYFGQNNDGVGVASVSGTPSFLNPESLFNPTNDSALNAAATTQAAQQTAQPDSLYNVTQNAFIATGAIKSSRSCQILRTVTMSPGPSFSVNTSDTCSVGADCKLKEETICDYSGSICVKTYKNFNPTGEKPSPECTNFGGNIVCNNGTSIYSAGGSFYSGSNTWYRISREYECKTENPINNAATEINAATNVIASTSKSGDVVSYSDGTSRSFTTPQVPAKEECQKSCKVKKPIANNSVTANATVTNLNKTTVAYDYIVRPCDSTNVCPINPDEQLVIDCSCVQGFTEAATVMQSLFDASKDLTCSSN